MEALTGPLHELAEFEEYGNRERKNRECCRYRAASILRKLI